MKSNKMCIRNIIENCYCTFFEAAHNTQHKYVYTEVLYGIVLFFLCVVVIVPCI